MRSELGQALSFLLNVALLGGMQVIRSVLDWMNFVRKQLEEQVFSGFLKVGTAIAIPSV
ncbi:hypothetical protein [Microbulbifer pacificus]|uniref:Uncharacterized protein n=1 Tax=Microbulbifer pacificus TaxID=407164 RepID=A0AAU0N1T4_9GAMM|nr:hypothetical protein [Microbulbifer pacificus]WOX06423.1 hypothetical protein R5R33_04640 [Microbulbifer pacificus]